LEYNITATPSIHPTLSPVSIIPSISPSNIISSPTHHGQTSSRHHPYTPPDTREETNISSSENQTLSLAKQGEFILHYLYDLLFYI
jgi:hypothetical protein